MFYSFLHSCVEIKNGASVCLIPNETTRYIKKIYLSDCAHTCTLCVLVNHSFTNDGAEAQCWQ